MATRLLGSKGTVSRIGLVTLRTQWVASTMREAISFIQEARGFAGLWRTDDCIFSQAADGRYEIEAVFEGATVDFSGGDDDTPGSPEGADDGGGGGSDGAPTTLDQVDLSFNGTMEKSPIQTHPNFEELQEKYGWDAEREQFAEYLPFLGPLGLGRQTRNGRSRLAGLDSFLEAGGEMGITYVASSVPESATKGVGTKQDPPSIAGLNLPESRNFLKLAPQIRQRGRAIIITERYMMSGPNGWNEDVYAEANLDPTAN